jgi:hypothetical protein
MRRGLLLAVVLLLGSAGAGLAAPHHTVDKIRRACELGHPCHRCPAGEWWCGSAGACIPNNQGCRLL